MSNILVLIQLCGGNDGGNTVFHEENDKRHREARGALHIPFSRALKITDGIALHPSLEPLANLFKEGRMSIVQNVGSPGNSFSHFRESDIRHTASNADEYLSEGWIGRYLDLTPETITPGAITAGSVASLATRGTKGKAINILDPNVFYDFEDTLALTPHEKVAFIHDVRMKTEGYMSEVKKAWEKNYGYKGRTGLGKQLAMVCSLILGGLETQVYHVQMSGFDTHAGQVNSGDPLTGLHSYLLAELAREVNDFVQWLRGQTKNTITVMTYSEFGREVKANGSFGTDHGHAAPMFIFGDNIKTQVIGSTPDLSGTVIPHEFDFRQVYASVLQNMGANPKDVLLRDFAPLPIFKEAPPLVENPDIEAVFDIRGGKKYTLFTNKTWV
jgi:uncharacterized protein (DUF1501 family)